MENCKKRKLGDEDSEQTSSNYDDYSTEKIMISVPVDNTGELMIEKFGSDQVPAICSSSEEPSELLVGDCSESVDLKGKIFKTDEKSTSVNNKFSETSPVSEICGGDDAFSSDEIESSVKKSLELPMMPSIDELEEFVSTIEKHEQKRFIEKYNFDVLNDVPLEGEYEWIRLAP